SKVLALANAQQIWGINAAGTTVYPLIELDANDIVRIASTARIVGIGPLSTVTNAVAKDVVLAKGGGLRRENNAQSAALLLLDGDSADYARLGFDTNVAGLKAYAAGSLVMQVDGTALAIPGASAAINLNGLSAMHASSGVLELGFSNSWTGVKLYNGANSNYCFAASSTSVSLQFGGTSRVIADGTGVGFNGQTPAKPNITGALSSITDANAKAVI